MSADKKKVSAQNTNENAPNKDVSVEVVQNVRVQISYFVDENNMGCLDLRGMGATGTLPYSAKNMEQLKPFLDKGLVIIKN